jgi:hypothetical protein
MDEAEQPTDDRLVRVYLKIRAAISATTKEYDARIGVLKRQQDQLRAELLKRLHERKSTQTKTTEGVAYIVQRMNVSIADEDLFGRFVLDEQDTDFYHKRVSIEHLREWSKAHDGAMPPGLNIFTELEINVRRPTKKGAKHGSIGPTGGDFWSGNGTGHGEEDGDSQQYDDVTTVPI